SSDGGAEFFRVKKHLPEILRHAYEHHTQAGAEQIGTRAAADVERIFGIVAPGNLRLAAEAIVTDQIIIAVADREIEIGRLDQCLQVLFELIALRIVKIEWSLIAPFENRKGIRLGHLTERKFGVHFKSFLTNPMYNETASSRSFFNTNSSF